MSKTDKTRPYRVQVTDARAMRADHTCAGNRYRSATACDLPDDSHSYANTRCAWEPVVETVRWQKMFADPTRKHCRAEWYARERAARRAALRSLTRDANSVGDIDEDVIENRSATLYSVYGGGWWD